MVQVVEDFKHIGKWVKYKGTWPDKVQTRAASLWYGMRKRVREVKKRPTYEGCTISTEFLDFQVFAEWCQSQVGYGNDGWELDKDLLLKGNKVYSPSTCVFVPPQINAALVKSDKARGSYPVGVCYKKANAKFVAQVGTGTGQTYLGLFETADAAFSAYKAEKENFLRELAEQYKEQIDGRAYVALRQYEVSRDD
jgi:hypothetical protein